MKTNKMTMEYIDMNDMRLSQIGLGTASFKNYTNIPRLIELALGFGINWIDTSKSYVNEDLLHSIGKALKYYERCKYYVLSKISPLECKMIYDDIQEYIQMQCNAMCCNYLDMLAIDSFNGFRDIDKQISALNEHENIKDILNQLKESGLVKKIGFVYIGGDNNDINKIMSLYDWDFVELRYNIFDITFSNVYQIFKQYQEDNKDFNIILMGLFDHGILHNILIDDTNSEEIILKYYKGINNPFILGVSTFPQLFQLISIYSNLEEINDDDSMMEKIYSYIESASKYNCRGCLKCVHNTCNDINIYYIIQRYNKYKYSGDYNDIKAVLKSIDLDSFNIDDLKNIDCLSDINFEEFIKDLKILKEELL